MKNPTATQMKTLLLAKTNKLSSYTLEELEDLYREVWDELGRRSIERETISIKTLCINGITTKDFVVRYADYDCSPDDPEFRPTFSFLIKRGKKEYCIYYDFNQEKPQKWWPTKRQGLRLEDENAAFDFIPSGFCEASENIYEYSGTTEEAIECLKNRGFTDIQNAQERA